MTTNDEINTQDAITDLQNQYYSLRGLTLRRLRREVALLKDGLYALKQPVPKLHVTMDHVERVIEGLETEITRILNET
jgi:hypothetical protein